MTNETANTDERNQLKLLLVIVTVVQFVAPFVESATFVALPAIGSDLHASAFLLGMTQTALNLGIAAFVVPAGRFADIYGRKKVFIAGNIVACIAALGLGLSASIWFFILLRFLIGIGFAMVVTTSFAMITNAFPVAKRGRVMGIVIGSVYLGSTLGPTIAGFIITCLGWRWIFYLVSAGVALVLIPICSKFRGEWRSAAGEPFEWGSALLFIVAMCLLVYGITDLNRSDVAKVLVVVGIVIMGLFVWLQWRSSSPILDIHLLVENLGFTFATLATFLNYAAYASFMFFFALYLQYVKGLSPQYAGLLLLVQPLMQTVLTPIAGRLSDTYRPAHIAAIGMAVCTVGLFLSATIDGDSSLPMIAIAAAMVGASLGIFSSSNMMAIMASVESRHVGTASSMVATMRSIGRLAAATIIAVFLSHYMGDAQVTDANLVDFSHVMKIALYFFSGLSLVGTCFSLVTGGRTRS